MHGLSLSLSLSPSQCVFNSLLAVVAIAWSVCKRFACMNRPFDTVRLFHDWLINCDGKNKKNTRQAIWWKVKALASRVLRWWQAKRREERVKKKHVAPVDEWVARSSDVPWGSSQEMRRWEDDWERKSACGEREKVNQSVGSASSFSNSPSLILFSFFQCERKAHTLLYWSAC